jgi:hypothetical protein
VSGEAIPDKNQVKWMKFVLARSNVKGGVSERDLEIGNIAGNVTVEDTTQSLTFGHPQMSKEYQYVLEKTLILLYSEIVANKDKLVGMGADAFAI